MAFSAALPRTEVLADLAGRSRVRDAVAVLAGAAWVAAVGQVQIPLGFTPVPLSLGTFAVLTAGLALGARRAALSLALFALVGFAGAPVFAGGAHGIAVPTAGYIVGYIAAATLAGWASNRGVDRKVAPSFVVIALCSAVVYLIGVPYLAYATDTTIGQALTTGMFPFLLGDAIKAAAASAAFPAAWKVITKLRDR
ncbi:MAG: biotin transporter BioY [Bifidobacteriaceae bacterium]|jgi:biotin transport system substrate-specific component|nr:biotin transporter BioY [Bifidobacteriaceae bacterium]